MFLLFAKAKLTYLRPFEGIKYQQLPDISVHQY